MIAAIVAVLAIGAAAQERMGAAEPTEKDKTESIPSKGYLKRGGPVGAAAKVSLAKVMENPSAFVGKIGAIEGVIVRSCKMEGCWAEIAPEKGARSVRVTMKDHAFFIPLESAGALARAEGIFSVETLTKEHVDHLINQDGAKFDNRNADGTVTEVGFEAIGIELRRSGR
jgi:hypothetical protein